MNTWPWFLVGAALLGIAGLLLVVLHKVRRLHLMAFGIADDAAVARREAQALFDQVHALTRLDRLLGLTPGLPDMRGWAGSPDMLLHVARHVLARQPACVVECSSGVSTVVIARCLQLNARGHVWSLEHDPQYAATTRALLAEHGLADWATVVDAPLVKLEGGGRWYDHAQLPAELPAIELLVVDGPPAGGGSTARGPALAQLRARFAPAFTVMLDDANRDGERAVVADWMRSMPELVLSRPAAEKGLAVLRRG